MLFLKSLLFFYFLLLFCNRWEKFLDDSFLLFLLILNGLGLIFLFILFFLVFVVLDKDVKVESDHEKGTFDIILPDYVSPVIHTPKDGILGVLELLLFEVVVGPDEVDFEEFDGEEDFQFGEDSVVGQGALVQQPQHDVLEPVEEIGLPEIQKFNVLLQQILDGYPVRLVEPNDLFEQDVPFGDVGLIVFGFDGLSLQNLQ